MKPELAAYRGKKICVAVSGGRDSMALLHCLINNAEEYGLTVSALNCDHRMRENSAKDSAFVKCWCEKRGVKLLTYVADGPLKTEAEARNWRRSCYLSAAEGVDGSGEKLTAGADFIATAHHLNDNAETALLNLARGSALAGVTGIRDGVIAGNGGKKVKLIHPLIACTREEIDAYVAENNVPYVDDETNFSDAYTRNYMRNNVLSALEKAVPEAAKAIYRFSRIAARDEEFINAEVKRRGVLKFEGGAAFIKECDEALFSRAAVIAVKDFFGKKDYTSAQVDNLYKLCSFGNGKKFEFLGLTAYGENDGICIEKSDEPAPVNEVPFWAYTRANSSIFGGQSLKIAVKNGKSTVGALRFDIEAVPENAVIRFMKSGDKFKKFGGGTKSLGDFFTDKKISVRLRKSVPLICDGTEVLAVCGVEISDRIKVTDKTKKVGYIICDLKL